MKTMAIMTGIQGSGKSEFCKRHLSSYERINLDTLHTRNKENIALNDAVSENRDIVIDNTDPDIQSRKKYIDIAKENGYYIVGYFMQSRIKDCIERNNQREGKARVSDAAIVSTSNKLQMPSYDEGFDELYYVSIKDNDFLVEKWRE